MASAKARGKQPEKPPSAFQPYAGAKKLVIKNLRASSHRQAKVAEYYARTERELEDAVDAVFAGRTGEITLEKLYRGVEDLCRKGDADKVYMMMKAKVDSHLQRVVLPRIHRDGGISNLGILRAVLAQWDLWNKQSVGVFVEFGLSTTNYGPRYCFARLLAFSTGHIYFAQNSHPSTT